MCAGYADSTECQEPCCAATADDTATADVRPPHTFNSQVKAAGSPTKKDIKRGKINQDPKGQPSPQNLDQMIKEFAKIDTASAAVTKGVQQIKDAATEIEKNEMSPIRTKQLRDDVLGKAISPEQRELL